MRPAGVHSIITNEWNFIQEKIAQVYADGLPVAPLCYPNWTSDGPDSSFETVILDASDNLYSIDGPNIAPISVPTTEVYYNFYDYITWNSQVASSTNNYWHWQGRYNYNNTPNITFTDLGTGTVTIPTNAFYPPE